MELTGGHLEYFCTKCSQGKYNISTFIKYVYRYPPFYDANPYDIYRRIAVGYFEFPANISMPGR
jgi:hypothetical protein